MQMGAKCSLVYSPPPRTVWERGMRRRNLEQRVREEERVDIVWMSGSPTVRRHRQDSVIIFAGLTLRRGTATPSHAATRVAVPRRNMHDSTEDWRLAGCDKMSIFFSAFIPRTVVVM